MSDTDTELFELCKEVYKRTGWGKDEEFDNWVLELGFKPEQYAQWQIPELWHSEMGWSDESQWPLYTSDFLLEKLPFEEHDLFLATNPGVGWWVDSFDNEINIPRADADTPLKALLKLVIALDDAGVKL